MLHTKNEFQKLDAQFAEKRKDIDTGDVVEIMESAKKWPNRFDPTKDQTVIKIKTKNGARYMNLNNASVNILIDEFGSNNDKDWVGKEAKILLNPTVIGGKKVIIAYLVGKSWELDDYGEPVNPGAQADQNDEIPTIEEDVDIADIPY